MRDRKPYHPDARTVIANLSFEERNHTGQIQYQEAPKEALLLL